ncbi:MAG: exopeptidase [Planctomycetota bacterium]|nr:MAG: exopeptidase [Planctomycetota bacterium]
MNSMRIGLAFVLLTVEPTLGDDNLLGLPKPNDPKKPGALVLHGGGRVTNDVFDRFVELAGGRNARIVFVPSAGYRVGDFDSEEDLIEALEYRYSGWVSLRASGQVGDFRFLYTDDPEDADSPAFVKAIDQSTGVWFSGGDQLRLNYRFVGPHPTQTRFQVALHRVLARGGVVGGTSAGTAALPEIMTLWSEREHETAPANAVAAHGLGLMTGAIVEQHFETRGGRFERFLGLFRDSQRLDHLCGRRGMGRQMIGLAVEEPAALIVRGNHLEVLGSGSAHIFLKSAGGQSVAWHELGPRESAILKKTEAAPTHLLREEAGLGR